VDTLEFPPSKVTNANFFSTDRLIMVSNDMTDTLKNPHPFKNKFQKLKSPELSHSPIDATGNKRPPALTQPILSSPQQHKYQMRSQTKINTVNTSTTPLLPRVITPMTGQAVSPRVPTRSQNLSPRNLSQNDFWSMGTANVEITL
jgi:hypothetical protein